MTNVNGKTPTKSRSRQYQKWRGQVLDRDLQRCRYCGARHDLVLDHVAPQGTGGVDHHSNLVTACRGCNTIKSNGAVRPVSLREHKMLIQEGAASIDWIWTSTIRTAKILEDQKYVFRRLYHVRGILWDDHVDWLLLLPDQRRPVDWVKGRPVRRHEKL